MAKSVTSCKLSTKHIASAVPDATHELGFGSILQTFYPKTWQQPTDESIDQHAMLVVTFYKNKAPTEPDASHATHALICCNQAHIHAARFWWLVLGVGNTFQF